MIRVAICDDQAIFIEQLETLLKRFGEEFAAPLCIETFSAGQSLLLIEQTYDLIFLDIDMPEMSGMDVAKHLRANGCQSLIVFVTSHQEHVFDAFEVNAFRFLVKPATAKSLNATMSEAIRVIREKQTDILPIELSSAKFIQIPAAEIIYIESLGKYTYIQTPTERYETRQALKLLEDQLESKGFFRTHKSYLVNLRQVKAHTQLEVELLNGETVHLSRLKSSAFKKAFIAELMRSR